MSEIIRSIEAKQLRTDIPAIAVGDTVKVMVKVVPGAGGVTASSTVTV